MRHLSQAIKMEGLVLGVKNQRQASGNSGTPPPLFFFAPKKMTK